MIFSILMQLVLASPNPLPIAWGFATSAYQIEGAWDADGKGRSVWDQWYNDPSRAGQPNANVANDHYHRMKEDIAYLGQLGATAYRFSVSWPRILPNCDGSVNQAGIKFYSDMIDELLNQKIEPILTLFHWDTPQVCHDRYQSWLNPQIVTDFTNYADVIFQNFGSRLKYILTVNEPHAFCGFGFEQNYWPPGTNAGVKGLYRCLHNVNLVHGSVHKLAASKYPQYGLKFGMPLIVSYGVPYDPNSAADVQAAKDFNAHQTDIHYGVFASGDYPAYLRTLDDQWVTGSELLTFTPEEKIMVNNSLDFVGLNYYSANYVSTTKSNLPAIGPSGGTAWQAIYPPGLEGLSKWAFEYYNRDIIITECGTSVANELSMTVEETINDTFRQNFFEGIVASLTAAVETDKLPIKAFLAWSLFDNFEWK